MQVRYPIGMVRDDSNSLCTIIRNDAGVRIADSFLEAAVEDSDRLIWQCFDLPATRFGTVVSFNVFDRFKFPIKGAGAATVSARVRELINSTLAAASHLAYTSGSRAIAYSDIHCMYSRIVFVSEF